ncbi:hypothetical protein JFN94_26050 [Burkholderia anthina]|uniref:Uncharacterized protein n=1 Tax=Burkholderia anthina TaxID=179879 RepID=A0A7T6VMV0_9BURK|nr:hypothetical protein [Burkholderia anthina]QQK06854.1 hypothetical protein JFN94_26050 [Burkholderia anthina]
MDEKQIKHTPWRTHLVDDTLVIDSEGNEIAKMLGDYDVEWERMERAAKICTAAPDMALALELLAADADAGKVMILSGLRLAIDAALIKAGRKKAPEPVRHIRTCGEGL